MTYTHAARPIAHGIRKGAIPRVQKLIADERRRRFVAKRKEVLRLRSLVVRGRAKKSSDAMIEPSFRLPDGVLWNVLSFWPPRRPKTFWRATYRTADRGPGVFLPHATGGRATLWTWNHKWSTKAISPRVTDDGQTLSGALAPGYRGRRRLDGSLAPTTAAGYPRKLLDAAAQIRDLNANCEPPKPIRPRISAAAAPLVVLQLGDLEARRLAYSRRRRRRRPRRRPPSRQTRKQRQRRRRPRPRSLPRAAAALLPRRRDRLRVDPGLVEARWLFGRR